LACHFTFGGYAAHAMEVSVDQGGVHIHRCICAVDVGQPVNPLGIEAQMMGGTLDGISAALRLQITVEGGRVVQKNFADYRLLRMAQAPEVEVHIIPSTAVPCGAGEMGVPSALPALANAIFAATGRRVRRLPIEVDMARMMGSRDDEWHDEGTLPAPHLTASSLPLFRARGTSARP
jgi:isoquinoline 1-oxidoreductase beta subunit